MLNINFKGVIKIKLLNFTWLGVEIAAVMEKILANIKLTGNPPFNDDDD